MKFIVIFLLNFYFLSNVNIGMPSSKNDKHIKACKAIITLLDNCSIAAEKNISCDDISNATGNFLKSLKMKKEIIKHMENICRFVCEHPESYIKHKKYIFIKCISLNGKEL